MTDHAGSYGGLSFGAGTPYRVRRLKLYRRSTNILIPDLPRYHGGLIGASYEAARIIEIDFMVEGSTQAQLVTRLDTLFKAFQPQVDKELPFVWGLPGQPDRRILCRAQAGDSELDPSDWASKSEEVPFRLVASDPAVYDNTLISATLTPFTSSAGLSYPVTYPKAYGSGGTGGGQTVTNTGDWESWPLFRINGPTSGTMTNPRIESVTLNEHLALDANGGVSMTAGQVLIIDTHPARRSINFDTGASRYGKLSAGSEWFPINPGSNELRFRASGETAGASVTVEVRAARI